MIRKALLVLSLVLLVGTVVLWLRSYYYCFPPGEARRMARRQVMERISRKPSMWFVLICYAFLCFFVSRLVSPAWPKALVASILVSVVSIGYIYLVSHPILRDLAIEHGYCVNCRYDLTGNESGVCPECGEEI